MLHIYNKIKINNFTYLFIIICFLCGYIKNITIIFFICFIHELGHVFISKLLNYKIISIEILPFGGFTTIDTKINSSINKDILIACGGFISQIILMCILYLFKNYLNTITYNLFITYNIILFIFNLIPIIPLDGSKIMHLILEKVFPYQLSYYLNLYLSIIILVIFLYLNYHYQIDNYFIFSFLIYKLIEYWYNFRYLKKRFLIERLGDFPYHKIINNTKNIKSLRKNVLHYFKVDKHYIKEDAKISAYLQDVNSKN